jgi:hypothetical protein
MAASTHQQITPTRTGTSKAFQVRCRSSVPPAPTSVRRLRQDAHIDRFAVVVARRVHPAAPSTATSRPHSGEPSTTPVSHSRRCSHVQLRRGRRPTTRTGGDSPSVHDQQLSSFVCGSLSTSLNAEPSSEALGVRLCRGGKSSRTKARASKLRGVNVEESRDARGPAGPSAEQRRCRVIVPAGAAPPKWRLPS